MIWSPPGASSFPCSFPYKINELTHTHTHTYTHTHVQRLRRSFPSKINGPSNAANAIAAKFGAPAGTMRRDFHVVSANNWICPQFGSDEARFVTPSSPSPTRTHTRRPACLRLFPLILRFIALSLSCMSLSSAFFSLSHFCCSFLPVSILLRHLQHAPSPLAPCLLPSEAYAHIYWAEAGEINSDLNVLSWCVSVVKASVNRVQKRMMLLLFLFCFFTACRFEKFVSPPGW